MKAIGPHLPTAQDLLVYSRSFGMNSTCTIPDESTNSSSIAWTLDLSYRRFFFIGDDGDVQVAECSSFSCESHRKRYISFHVMIWLSNIPSLSALSISRDCHVGLASGREKYIAG
jgi:hypothetical protein